MDWTWLHWPVVAALGAIVGASELVSRYKDAPGAAIRTWPAASYIAINAAASVGAPALIHAPDGRPVRFGSRSSTPARARWPSCAHPCSSCAPAPRRRVGPSGFLHIFLSADRSVVRTRAAARSAAVAKVMKGVDFDKAKESPRPTASV
jgi:hypothetical protein